MNRKRASATHGPAAGKRLAERRAGKYVPLSDAGARGRRRTGWHVAWPDRAIVLPPNVELTVYRLVNAGPAATSPPPE